jgi:hypothetical protein
LEELNLELNLSNGSSAVAKHSTHHPKDKGSGPATALALEEKKIMLFLNITTIAMYTFIKPCGLYYKIFTIFIIIIMTIQ